MPEHRRTPNDAPRAAAFYRKAVAALQQAGVEFLIGGGHAIEAHTGEPRQTNDFDVFLIERDVPQALAALAAAGFRTELTYPHWLAKAHFDSGFIDLIFNSGNGCCPVDREWFAHAREHMVLEMTLKVCPPEETIWQKAFVMERERFDGADVVHLLRACGDTLDWSRLLKRFGSHWPVLLAHLVLFRFVYPGDTAMVSDDILSELSERLQESAPRELAALCRGTLLSRTQYLADVAKPGCIDARLPPFGAMTSEQIALWTTNADAD